MLDIQTLTDIDISSAGVRSRRRRNKFARQDRAAELVASGMKPKDIASELETSTEMVRLLAHASSRRKQDAATASMPHPDVASLGLTPPESELIRALAVCEIRNYEACASSPKTWEVSSEASRSGSWAATVGRKRLDNAATPAELRLVRVAGNGFVTLTDLGWTVAAALHPEAVADIL